MLELVCKGTLADAPFALELALPVHDAGWRHVRRSDFALAIAKSSERADKLRMPALNDADLAAFGIKAEKQQWLKVPRSAARMMENVCAATRGDDSDKKLIATRMNLRLVY